MEQNLMYLFLICGAVEYSNGIQTPNQRVERPDDFAVFYEWKEGSLPPPYHYEYSIELHSTGQGKVTMTPDYPSFEVPMWTETFSVQPIALETFYQLMIHQGLLTNDWQAQSDLLVGGSIETMIVKAHEKVITIPAFVISTQSSQAKYIFSALNSLVPKDTWDKFNSLRNTYMEKLKQPSKTKKGT